MSLRRRLAVLTAVAVAVAILAAFAIGYVIMRGELRGEVDDSLRELAAEATLESPDSSIEFSPPQPRSSGPGDRRREPEARREPGEPEPLTVPAEEGREARVVPLVGRANRQRSVALPAPPAGGAPGYAQLITPDGDVLRPRGSGPGIPVGGRELSVARGDTGPILSDVEVGGEHFRVLTTPLARQGALQVARPLDEVDRALRNLALVLGGVSLAGIGLAAALGLLVARRALRPVSELTRAAEHVTQVRDFAHRIDVPGNDELTRLASSFNAMLEALEHSMGTQRQLVADASHELRTPLTSLRANIAVLRRSKDMPAQERQQLLEDVTAQLEELSALVNDLLELAREEELEGEREEIRLDLLTAQAIERRRRGSRDVEFETELEPCVVSGSPALLERAIDNLLDNACKWSSDGGPVTVSVRDGEIAVRDHGPGIPEDDLPYVFDRFYRGRAARELPGSGLGLAIVRHVAEAHAGHAWAENAEGGGALLRISLPSAGRRAEPEAGQPLD